MDEYDICHNLMQWVETFPGLGKVVSPQTLSDGQLMGKVLHAIDSNHFTAAWLSRLKEDCGDNRRLKFSNLRKVHQSVVEYLQYLGLQTLISADISKISDDSNAEETGKMLQLILGCAMNCNDKERHIESIMAMPADVQAVVMNTLQTMFVRESSPGVEMMPTGPASFHPNHRTITEQLETTTRARDEAVSRVHELEMQLSEMSDQHSELKTDNEKLLQKLEGLEDTGDLNSTASGGTMSRYKDLKKKIDTLQDDLFKVETSRDEYRARVEELQSQHADMLARTDELQKMADLAHTLQDEVDVLKDMGQRATQAESTIESYKKKLDELSDLKRQNKLIEEKNADYMQHILELEEDIKKNGSWRPQLEMFKKQTNDLRQMLSEETKKADRLSFENKKLQEKVEAITLEKDRVCIERETLREQCEDLRCENSVDPRNDSSRGDLLSANHQEMWEKVIRLQHENQQLKKQQTEGLTEPVLQAMVSDLTERHDNVATENRCYTTTHSTNPQDLIYCTTSTLTNATTYTSSNAALSVATSLSSDSSLSNAPSLSLLNTLNSDHARRVKMLKRNLKWASESDLLIVRQSTTVPMVTAKPLRSKTMPKQSRPNSEGSQHIVIRHIHEFKVGGSEKEGEMNGQDLVSTLDSGISGVYDCLSPLISSIAEGCATVPVENNSPSHTVRHTHNCSPVRDCGCSSSPVKRSIRSSKSRSPSGSRKGSNFASREILSSDFRNNISTSGVSSNCSSPDQRENVTSDSPTPHNSPRMPNRLSSRNRKSSRSPSCGRSSRSQSRSSFSGSNSETERLLRHPQILQRSQSHSENRTRRDSNFSISSNDSLKNYFSKRTPTPDSDAFTRRLVNLRNSYNMRETMNGDQNVVFKNNTTPVNQVSVGKVEKIKACEGLAKLQINDNKHTSRTNKKPVSVVRGIASAIRQPSNSALNSSNSRQSLLSETGTQQESCSGKSTPRTPGLLETNFDSGCFSTVSCNGTPPLKPRRISYSNSLGSGISNSNVDNRNVPEVRSPDNASQMPKKGLYDIETHFGMHVLSPDSDPVTVLKHKSPKHSRYNSANFSVVEPMIMSVSVEQQSPLKLDIQKETPVKPVLKGSPVRVLPISAKSTGNEIGNPKLRQLVHCTSSAKVPPSDKLPFRRTASVRANRPLTFKSRQNDDVALHRSDTLFTNANKGKLNNTPPQSVPSTRKYPNSFTNLVPSLSQRSSRIDSDSDGDVLEHRLMAGAYGAPLESSESYISIMSHADTDPSATDYYTDNCAETYELAINPQHFKVSYDDVTDGHLGSAANHPHRKSLTRIQEEGSYITSPQTSPTKVTNSHSSPHISSPKEKRLKKLTRTNSLSGIVKKKKKHKTAKMLASETFNAVFTFCTP